MGGVIYGGTQGDVSVPILIPFKSEFDLFCEWKRKKPVKFTPRIIIVRTVSEPVLIIFLWGRQIPASFWYRIIQGCSV
jgi:hypothetical protein